LEAPSSYVTAWKISFGRWKRAGTISKYFYDSWAILEYLNRGRLAPYFRSGRGVTTWLQVMEVFYALLLDGKSELEAKDQIAALQPHLIDFSFDDVLGAMGVRIRMNRNRRNLSYVDAIGYYLAQKRRLRFLTRDPGFRGLRGVLVP
jgi:predicted nucleic acid-binding protein